MWANLRMYLLLLALPSAISAYQVLHLADFHLDIEYSINGDNTKMCHDDGQKRNQTLGPFGDYMCDAPKPLIQHAIDESARLFPNPDLIIWTGDNVAHIEGYGWEVVLDAVNQTTSLLFSRFPNQTILPTFGNHDYCPSNGFESESSLYTKTWELWKGKLGDENKATFLKGGYYKYRLPNATAVVLNTNLYYSANKAYVNFTNKIDPADQFAFLETELENAEKCPNRISENCTSLVHIIAHIAPGAFEKTPNITWFRDEYNERFLNLTVRYANSIGWMIFGHHHTDTFHLIKDEKENVVQLALMSPAVTPWFSTLPGAGANNPTFRVYETDLYSKVEDIKTYYINLDELNKNASTPFIFEYSFKDAYGIIGDITPNAVSDVLEKMKSNDSLFMTYINYNTAFWNPVMPVDEYKGAQLCSMEYADYPRYQTCLSKYEKSANTDLKLPIFSLLAIFYTEFLL
ncbi:hypothetical protein B9Z55_019537 [Caenorhabditis nigoni]|uniref:Uncharacterized protein n=1 Tax=Caenorhabditis nigoni TaxID=1611254 RepID=A0A2G5TJF5_9PELO|nr:hypothetical protein B9Z55_019537 [Caenorhabditis nigoni]